jgi:ribosomal silencing factor RsfS
MNLLFAAFNTLTTVSSHQLKERDLRHAIGSTGAEGGEDDDWLIVDCYDSCIHFMMPGLLGGRITNLL